jgi:hypothetical protein
MLGSVPCGSGTWWPMQESWCAEWSCTRSQGRQFWLCDADWTNNPLYETITRSLIPCHHHMAATTTMQPPTRILPNATTVNSGLISCVKSGSMSLFCAPSSSRELFIDSSSPSAWEVLGLLETSFSSSLGEGWGFQSCLEELETRSCYQKFWSDQQDSSYSCLSNSILVAAV